MIIRFNSEYHAHKWEWLFCTILRMHYCCANGYYNAFCW